MTDARFTISATDRSAAAFRSVRTSLRETTSRVVNMRTAIGVLAGSAGIGLLVRNNLQAIDSLAKFSDTIGDSTENVQAMRRQAELSGVDIGTMDSALQRASRRAAQAADDTGAAADAYDRLGLSAREVADMAPTDAFWAQADAIANLTSRSDQLRAANELFGREAEDVIRIIDSGRDSFESIKQEMELTGQAISRIDAAQVEAANDAITRMQGSVSVVGQQLAIQLAPIITGVADRIAGMTQEGNQFGDIIVGSTSRAVDAVGFVADSFRGVQVTIKGANVVALGFSSAVLSAIELSTNAFVVFADTVNGTINELLIGFNKLPGVSIPLIASLENEGWVQGIRELGEVSRAVLTEERAALHDTMMQPMPSVGIKRFVEESQQEIEKIMRDRGEVSIPGIDGGDDGELDQKLQGRLDKVRAHLQTESEAIHAAYIERTDFIWKLDAEHFETEQERYQLLTELHQDYQQRLTDITDAESDKRSKKEEEAEQAIQSMKMQTFRQGVGLLQALSGESKAAAIAAIALNKGLSIAQTIQNTATAVMKAQAADPTGVLAGKAAMLGKVQLGIIAATGLAQAASVGSGGASMGSPANPVSTTQAGAPPGGFDAQRPVSQQEVIVRLDSRRSRFTADEIDDIFEGVNEKLADGAQLKSIRVG